MSDEVLQLISWSGFRRSTGERLQGQLFADSVASARAQLWRSGLTPLYLRVKPCRPWQGMGGLRERGMLYRQLAGLLAAGIPLVQAFEVMAQSQSRLRLKQLLLRIKLDVEAGDDLAAAMARHPALFSRFYVSLIKMGEHAGVLERVLICVADHNDRSLALRQRIRQALAYPLVLIFVATVVCTVLLTCVVPQFAQIFEGLGAELPLMTRQLLQLSSLLRAQGFYGLLFVFLLLVICGFGIRRWPLWRMRWHKFRLLLPFWGRLWQQVIAVHFARGLALMLGSGVPLVDALTLLVGVMESQPHGQAVRRVGDAVAGGMSLHGALQKHATTLFPPLALHLISMGELSGNLEGLLLCVADFYEKELDMTVDALGVMLEPALMCVLGLLLGWMVIALYIPIFAMGGIV